MLRDCAPSALMTVRAPATTRSRVSVRRLVSASPGGLNHSERVSASAGCWGAMAASVSGRV